jgi:small-conductance mechanosensitive channel
MVFGIAAVSVLLIVALVLGLVLSRVLHYYARKFQGSWGEFFFSLLAPLPIPLLLLAALYTALENLTLPRYWEHLGSKLILALVILVLFYFPSKVLVLFLQGLGQREPSLERVTRPATVVVRVLFVLITTMVILDNLGIHLTGLWTTLGIGSVAVAFAMQETLSSLLAGFYILVDRPVCVGDYIKMDGGQEGYVVRIGWRSTVLRTSANNLVVIPNATMAKAVIVNYSMPEERLALNIPVSVGVESDPDRVEKALVETAQELARNNTFGLLPYPEPVALLVPGFGSSTLDFTLIVQVRNFAAQGRVQSELRKRILERFKRDGIEMPFPTKTLLLHQSTVQSLKGPRPDGSSPQRGAVGGATEAGFRSSLPVQKPEP